MTATVRRARWLAWVESFATGWAGTGGFVTLAVFIAANTNPRLPRHNGHDLTWAQRAHPAVVQLVAVIAVLGVAAHFASIALRRHRPGNWFTVPRLRDPNVWLFVALAAIGGTVLVLWSAARRQWPSGVATVLRARRTPCPTTTAPPSLTL